MIEHLDIYVTNILGNTQIKLHPGDIIRYKTTEAHGIVVATIHTNEASTVGATWGCIMYRVVPGHHARFPAWILEGGPYIHYPEDVHCWSFGFHSSYGRARSDQWRMVHPAAQDWWDVWGIKE
jgi:hypothetical protein